MQAFTCIQYIACRPNGEQRHRRMVSMRFFSFSFSLNTDFFFRSACIQSPSLYHFARRPYTAIGCFSECWMALSLSLFHWYAYILSLGWSIQCHDILMLPSTCIFLLHCFFFLLKYSVCVFFSRCWTAKLVEHVRWLAARRLPLGLIYFFFLCIPRNV